MQYVTSCTHVMLWPLLLADSQSIISSFSRALRSSSMQGKCQLIAGARGHHTASSSSSRCCLGSRAAGSAPFRARSKVPPLATLAKNCGG